MKSTRILAAIVLSLVSASMLLTGEASATVLCKTNTTPCTSKLPVGSEIKASLQSKTKLVIKIGAATVEASSSELNQEVTVAGSGSETTTATIVGMPVTIANCTVTTTKLGSSVWHRFGSFMDGVDTPEFETDVVCGATECRYGGVMKEGVTVQAGSPATIKLNEATLPKVGGGILCSNPSKWSGTYVVSSPSPLYLAES
jgi:hypothetical protein